MGLETVVSDIQEKGRREVETIQGETQREVEEILKSAQARVEKLKLEAEREVQDHIRRLIAQEDSAANLIVKRQVLNAQKEMLDQVYQKALRSLLELPEDFHQKALSGLLHQAVQEMRGGMVHANARDVPVLRDLIARDASLSGFKVGDAVDIEGGIVVENLDATMKIDLSYRTYLDQIWETALKDAADTLFT